MELCFGGGSCSRRVNAHARVCCVGSDGGDLLLDFEDGAFGFVMWVAMGRVRALALTFSYCCRNEGDIDISRYLEAVVRKECEQFILYFV